MEQPTSFPFISFYGFRPQTLETMALPQIDFQRISALLDQNSKVIAQNKALTSQINSLTLENKKLKSQNLQLKRERDNQFRLEKRKYTPRRTELEKKYACDMEGCSKSYSSIIALRNHERGVHKLMKRQRNCQA